jgi:predicted nuclease of predicted toxin-antitoxin system
VKALIDEQLSPEIAVLLRQAGFDVIAIGERSDLIGSSDRVVFDVATAENRAVITNNIKDFRPVAAERLILGQTHSGLILIPSKRTRTRAAVAVLADMIATILSDHPNGLADSERWVGPPST